MQYLLARDGQQLGQFAEEEIRSGLFEGRYLPTDAAWTEGMADWRPIGEIMGSGLARVAPTRSGAGSGAHHRATPTKAAGLAITALVLVAVAIVAALGLGAFGASKEKREFTEGIAVATKLVGAAAEYASRHDGRYPTGVDELAKSSGLSADLMNRFQSFLPEKWQGEPGFEYVGASLTPGTAGPLPVFRSRCRAPDGRRVVVSADGSIGWEQTPP